MHLGHMEEASEKEDGWKQDEGGKIWKVGTPLKNSRKVAHTEKIS